MYTRPDPSFVGRLSLEALECRRLLAGLFTFEEVLDFEADRSMSVAHADLDRDGDFDLVTANYWSDDMTVLLNTGRGEFREQTRYGTGGAPFFITVADLNSDGYPDVITTNADNDRTGNWTGSLSVLIGNGDGTFSPEKRYLTGGSSSAGIIAGDLDGDGDIDLAAANQYSHDVSVLLGNGDGTLKEPALYASGGQGTTGITAGDFDGDGDLDLAFSNYFFNTRTRTVGVLLGHGDGEFDPATTFHSGAESWDLKNGDVDRDGDLDLVVTTTRGPSVMLGNGDGTFAPGELRATWPPGADWNNPDPANPILIPFGHDLGDLNGDGILDLVLANESGVDPSTGKSFGMLSIMLGKGDGTFEDPVAFDAGVWPRSVAIVDIDGDGDVDVATSDMLSHKLTLLFNGTVPALIPGDANRDHKFDQRDIVQVLQAGKYLTGQTADWTEGDWNGDGLFDHEDVISAVASGRYTPVGN